MKILGRTLAREVSEKGATGGSKRRAGAGEEHCSHALLRAPSIVKKGAIAYERSA